MKKVYVLLGLFFIATVGYSQTTTSNDEIERVKKFGIDSVVLDSRGRIYWNRTKFGEGQVGNPMKYARNTTESTFYNEPRYVGDRVPENFGKSKYDKELSYRDVEGDRSLDDIRAERRHAEQKSIGTTVLIIIGVGALVIYLFKSAKK